jgi:hypothetical protein
MQHGATVKIGSAIIFTMQMSDPLIKKKGQGELHNRHEVQQCLTENDVLVCEMKFPSLEFNECKLILHIKSTILFRITLYITAVYICMFFQNLENVTDVSQHSHETCFYYVVAPLNCCLSTLYAQKF